MFDLLHKLLIKFVFSCLMFCSAQNDPLRTVFFLSLNSTYTRMGARNAPRTQLTFIMHRRTYSHKSAYIHFIFIQEMEAKRNRARAHPKIEYFSTNIEFRCARNKLLRYDARVICGKSKSQNLPHHMYIYISDFGSISKDT